MSSSENQLMLLKNKLGQKEGISSVAELSVKNEWNDYIRFSVQYKIDGVTLVWDSDMFNNGEKKAPILEGARDIKLSCDCGLVGMFWSRVFTMNYSSPVSESYRVYGGAGDYPPKYEQLSHKI